MFSINLKRKLISAFEDTVEKPQVISAMLYGTRYLSFSHQSF